MAARLAVDSLTRAFGAKPTGAGLSEAVTEANRVVFDHSLDKPELRGMGTTLTAAALVNEDGRDVIALVNVGDSRSYRYHDGQLTQITVDHSLAEEMVRSGELSEAEAAVHPHRHILTRALGVADEVAVDLWRIQPTRGDRFVLCSDGLTNELDEAQIAEVLATVPDPQVAADLLVRAARTHGGSDNITVVVADVVVGEDDEPDVPAVAAVAAEPENRAYRDSLGWVYYRLGRFPEAVAELEKALDEKRPDATILDHLGDAYQKLGNVEKASAAWRRAKEAYEKDKEPEKAKKVSEKRERTK